MEPLTCSGMDHTFSPAHNTMHAVPLPRKRSPDSATTDCGHRHLIAAYYSFIDPERLKGWVGLVGWPIADGSPTCGHSLTVGGAQDRESSPVKDQRSIAVQRNQPVKLAGRGMSCHIIFLFSQCVRLNSRRRCYQLRCALKYCMQFKALKLQLKCRRVWSVPIDRKDVEHVATGDGHLQPFRHQQKRTILRLCDDRYSGSGNWRNFLDTFPREITPLEKIPPKSNPRVSVWIRSTG